MLKRLQNQWKMQSNEKTKKETKWCDKRLKMQRKAKKKHLRLSENNKYRITLETFCFHPSGLNFSQHIIAPVRCEVAVVTRRQRVTGDAAAPRLAFSCVLLCFCLQTSTGCNVGRTVQRLLLVNLNEIEIKLRRFFPQLQV